MFRKSKLQSKEFSRKKRRFFWIKISAGVLLLIGLAVLSYYGVRSPRVTIASVLVEGNTAVSKDTIEKIAESKLAGNYLFLIPKRSTFFYPQDEIAESVLKSSQRIEKVEVNRKGLTSITVSVTERKPKFIWCRKDGEGSSQCYFLDAAGLIFSPAPSFSGAVYIVFEGSLADVKSSALLGSALMSQDKFTALAGFISSLQSRKIAPAKIIIKTGGQYEMFLSDGKRVLFSDAVSYEKAASNLDILLKDKLFLKEAKDSATTLDYIDLRFGNKMFYKFK